MARFAGPRFYLVAFISLALAVAGLSVWIWPETGQPEATQANSSGERPGSTSSADTDASAISTFSLPESERERSPTDQFVGRSATRDDDWDTERLSEESAAHLATLESLLKGSGPMDAAVLEALVASDFSCRPLVPTDLEEVFRDEQFVVRRLSSSQTPASDLRGAAGLSRALQQFMSLWGEAKVRQAKFKIIAIDQRQDHFSTRVLVEVSGRGATESRQVTATWQCQWSSSDDGQEPRLTRIAVEDFEETRLAIPNGRLFVDCTESAFAGEEVYQQQVLPGINHWLERIPKEFMGRFGHHGVAMGDVDGDGLDDLYVCDAGGLPNRLYVQQPNGQVKDSSSRAGVDLLEDSTGALLIDVDNDGDQDLVVGTGSVLQVAENDGSGRFAWHAKIDLNTDIFSISAADYDVDGDLDLYVCGYKFGRQDPTRRGLPFPLPYHDANNGGRNVMLQNDGGFRFADVTADVGLDVNNARFSMAAGWEDFDNDGDLDLYVANDFGRNNLFRNENGRFTDIASVASVEDQASGMSVAWGDYNRDGRPDLYVGNMFSAAGNRVTGQGRFSKGVRPETVADLRRMARGNTLFANATTPNGPSFRDESELAAVNMARWSWASKFVDFTNDGWPDLIAANGYVTGNVDDDL